MRFYRSGFKVWGIGFRDGLGSRVQDFGVGFRIQSSGFRVSGIGFRVWSLGYKGVTADLLEPNLTAGPHHEPLHSIYVDTTLNWVVVDPALFCSGLVETSSTKLNSGL